jgi:hypothetical protein
MRRLAVAWLRHLLAIAVLASIVGDLIDVHCDVPSRIASGATISGASAPPGDDCESSGFGCVPDCFCCCSATTAIPPLSIPAESTPGPRIERGAPLVLVAGVKPLPYRPPLPRA